MIAVIDYGAGNTHSVINALNDLNILYKVTNSEYDICAADKIILPGVGEASFAVKKMSMANIFNLLRVIKKPLLGICLGMQLLCEKSAEGNVNCLGVIPGSTQLFDSKNMKVPHMGWNKVKQVSQSNLFAGIEDDSYFYFAHSYYVPVNDFTIGSCNHTIDFTSVCCKDNFFGVQFHPEKSGEKGIKLLKNFIELC
jgi:imidazole glycerol-phosphate synthase subunit HisH